MKTFLTLMLGATILMGAQSACANIVGSVSEALEILDLYCLTKLVTGGSCAKCRMVCNGVEFHAASGPTDGSVANTSSKGCSKCLCEKMKGNWNETHEKCCSNGYHWIPWKGDLSAWFSNW